MNDDQKINQNTSGPSAVSGNQTQAQDSVQPVQGSEPIVQAQPQAQNVRVPNKEKEPMRSVVEKSDVELKIDKELENIGVEAKSDDVNLTPEHIKFGLEHAGQSVPVSTVPSGKVALPQTPMQVKKNIKKTKPTDSLRGLLLEILKNIQKIGIGEQKA